MATKGNLNIEQFESLITPAKAAIEAAMQDLITADGVASDLNNYEGAYRNDIARNWRNAYFDTAAGLKQAYTDLYNAYLTEKDFIAHFNS